MTKEVNEFTEKSTKGAFAEAVSGVIERTCRGEWEEAKGKEKEKLGSMDHNTTAIKHDREHYAM